MSTGQKKPSDATIADDESLQKINNQTLGTSPQAFPIMSLPDGSQVPTGTVGALLVNLREYDNTKDPERRKELEVSIRAAVPVLLRTGLFHLFSPDEWISGGGDGRQLVGRIAKELEKQTA